MLRSYLAAITLFAAAISGAAAQSPPRTMTTYVPVCADSALANYARCALWLDRFRLRRGQEGDVVATRAFLRPMHLTRILAGDSALAYARVYERNARRSSVFGAIGLGLEVAAIATFPYNRCDAVSFGSTCPASDAFLTRTVVLLGGSLASFIVSSHLTNRALRAATRAVWWHNANYAR